MKTLFKIIYESLCGSNQNISDYRQGIYSSVGILSCLAAVVIACLFYVVLGRWKNVWHTRVHWTITLVFAALTGGCAAFILAKQTIGSVDGYLIQFSLMNAALTAGYFFLLSCLFKTFSIHAKRTPF